MVIQNPIYYFGFKIFLPYYRKAARIIAFIGNSINSINLA